MASRRWTRSTRRRARSVLRSYQCRIQRAEDIALVFEALKGRADGLYVVGDPLVNTQRVRINTFALAATLPTMHVQREYVEAAGLMSYGPNYLDLNRRAADYVDRILRGAKPADLPVEQPTKFELVINLKTAKGLGLDSPADTARPRRRGDRIRVLFAATAHVRFCAGFRLPAMTNLSTRSGGRRPKSAKARNRGQWCSGGAAGAMGIWPRGMA